MQTPFYASGFLYSLKTHKILILESKQKDNAVSFWSTLGGEGEKGEDAQSAFQRIVYKLLNIKLKAGKIYPIYDYFHNTRNKINYVFYAEVDSTKTYNTKGEDIPSWFSFSETFKLPFNLKTKQDIVVGERVINAKWRDDNVGR